MNIAICDDEKLYIDKISECVNKVADKQGIRCDIHTCNNGEKLIDLCKEKKIDAVFLDIAMPGINGFETADELLQIRNNIALIFVSSQEAMVFSSYAYKPFWFVPKSKIAMLEMVVERLIKAVEENEEKQTVIPLKVEIKKVVEIDTEAVMYIKADGHYVNIFSKGEKRSDSYRSKLDTIGMQLERHGFVRVHNRYLVNLRMISVIEKSCCVLLEGTQIPISRANMAQTKELFQKHLRSTL
ncbi:MAG: LytR/AlgR family response regulator transcription factor [Clostridia bacterium]